MSTVLSTGTRNSFGPALVSEVPGTTLPVAPTRHRPWDRLRTQVGARRDLRCFQRAVRSAGASEARDLIVAGRRL